MNITFAKIINSLPVDLYTIKCKQDFSNMIECVEIKLLLQPTITGYVFVDTIYNEIYAVHLYRNLLPTSKHSRKIIDDPNNIYFKNEGEFECFNPNDTFETTVKKFFLFAQELTNGLSYEP